MHLALGGTQEACYHIECSGLARSVRPDQADDLPPAHTKAHVGNGDQSAKVDRDVLDRQEHRIV
ncbi:hypothetical protein D3C72_1821250 [compost metagenome]